MGYAPHTHAPLTVCELYSLFREGGGEGGGRSSVGKCRAEACVMRVRRWLGKLKPHFLSPAQGSPWHLTHPEVDGPNTPF